MARRSWISASLVAAIVLVAGVALALSLNRRAFAPSLEDLISSQTLILPGEPLFDVFEVSLAGESENLTASITASPRMTFRTPGGTYCRSIALSATDGHAALIACRRDMGWQIEAGAHEVKATNGSDPQTPSGRAEASMDAVAEQLMDGPPLGESAERAAISAGWR